MNQQPAPLSSSERYEKRDFWMRPMVIASVVLMALIGASLVASSFLEDALKGSADAGGPDLHPRAPSREISTEPLLQSHPVPDLEAYESAMQQALEEYRWIDPVGGVVQIPIERAMTLYLERNGDAGSEGGDDG